jgi:hypothetical protein
MSALCLQFVCYRKTLLLSVVVDSEDSDWLAWLYPSPYTAAHRFGIVIMALDGVFMRFDVNDNFLKTMSCAQCYF